jgi:predicted ABC-type ATPase
MFAGPNGSGKSTLKQVLPPLLLGVYINPDDLELEMRSSGGLDLGSRSVTTSEIEVTSFFRNSKLLQSAGLAAAAGNIGFCDQRIIFPGVAVNAYFASVAADFLRRKLIERRESFTFETVMSSPDKVAFLAQAQRSGYRTYLYYIATDDPEINISRVRSRVKQGGHPVPEDKIVSRYARSLSLLMDAIAHTNRAYIFDNSTQDQDRTWLAEITDGRVLEMKTDRMPAWFKRAVWDKIKPLA